MCWGAYWKATIWSEAWPRVMPRVQYYAWYQKKHQEGVLHAPIVHAGTYGSFWKKRTEDMIAWDRKPFRDLGVQVKELWARGKGQSSVNVTGCGATLRETELFDAFYSLNGENDYAISNKHCSWQVLVLDEVILLLKCWFISQRCCFLLAECQSFACILRYRE